MMCYTPWWNSSGLHTDDCSNLIPNESIGVTGCTFCYINTSVLSFIFTLTCFCRFQTVGGWPAGAR